LRIWSFFVQLAVAIPAAVAVIIPDDATVTLYILAIVGVALLALWWLINANYVKARAAAQGARRAALLFLNGIEYGLMLSKAAMRQDKESVRGFSAEVLFKYGYVAKDIGREHTKLIQNYLSQKKHPVRDCPR
jgi:hypothetical protein